MRLRCRLLRAVILRANITMAPIWNVVTVIPGAIDPEHVVVLGNHRDAWVAGAIDPTYEPLMPHGQQPR